MEMVRSACDPRWRDVAGALSAGEGNAKVSGLERRTDTTSAIVANSLLMHAFNREDSYRVAAHPASWSYRRRLRCNAPTTPPNC